MSNEWAVLNTSALLHISWPHPIEASFDSSPGLENSSVQSLSYLEFLTSDTWDVFLAPYLRACMIPDMCISAEAHLTFAYSLTASKRD